MTIVDDKPPVEDQALVSVPAPAPNPPLPPPPAYTAAGSSSSLPQRQPHNHLRIQRNNESIKDVFVIDPLLAGGTAKKNLSLETANGNVEVKVYLTGESSERVEMEGSSKNGNVKFVVCECPAEMVLHLLLSCKNGNTVVDLPPKFHGPLIIRCKNGTVKISPSLQPYLRILEEIPGRMHCWIGEWPGEVEDWKGDECIVENDNGGVKVGYREVEKELPSIDAGSGGWLRGLFKMF